MFVTSTGTIYLGTATTTATVVQTLPYSSSLTIGTELIGSYNYYGAGDYLTTYPQLAQYGSLSNSLIYPGLVISELGDVWTTTGVASGCYIVINGFTADPGQNFFNSITANNVTLLTSNASYAYFSNLPGSATQGVARWAWAITSQFGFKTISSTTVTISGLTQTVNQSIEQELKSYYPNQGPISLNSSTVRRLGQTSTGVLLLSQLRNRALTNLADHWIYSYNNSSLNYDCVASYTVNLATGAVSAQSTVGGYNSSGYPVTYPYQIWEGAATDRSLYSVQAVYSTSTTGTLTPTTGTLNTWYQLSSGSAAWTLSTGASADTHYNITLKINVKENSSGNIVDSCYVTLDASTTITAGGGGGGAGSGGGGGNIKPF